MPLWLIVLLGFLGLLLAELGTKKLEIWLVKRELVEEPEKQEKPATRTPH